MTRTASSRLVFILALCVSAVVSFAQASVAQPVQIHPPVAGPNRPITIVVLADNFTAAQQFDFDEAAANFFLHGLLPDGFYSQHASAITVKTYFRPVSAPRASNYGFRLGPGSNCSITWDHGGTNTAALVEDDAGPHGATHTVVIGNYNYNFGCQAGEWIYVAVGAVGRDILQHELGHLIAGLYDEFALPANIGQVPEAPIKRANCSTRRPAPHWNDITNPMPMYLQDCAHYPRIFRAFHDCRMGAHGTEFCPVCVREMNAEIACRINPLRSGCSAPPSGPSGSLMASHRRGGAFSVVRTAPAIVPASGALQDPSAPVPILRLLVRVAPDDKQTPMTIVAANDSNGRFIPRVRRVGDYVYEVTENGVTTALGVLPGNPFEARAYSGGLSEHTVRPTPDATFLIPVPNLIRSAALSSRPIALAIYKLGPAVNNDLITPARMANFKESQDVTLIGRLTPNQVQEQLAKLLK